MALTYGIRLVGDTDPIHADQCERAVMFDRADTYVAPFNRSIEVVALGLGCVNCDDPLMDWHPIDIDGNYRDASEVVCSIQCTHALQDMAEADRWT